MGNVRLAMGLLLVAGSLHVAVRATEEAISHPTPNPFNPVKLEKESMGAALRHPLHRISTTWVDYFKTWDKPRQGHEATTLPIIRSEPKFFLHRKVEFNIYFNKRGAFFRQFLTPFHRDTHGNFSCWAYGTELWDREQRTDVFPFLYVDLKHEKLIAKLDNVPQYTPLRVWGLVTIVSEGYPWIEIYDFEPIKEPTHTMDILRDMELATQQTDKKNWPLAASAFESVLEKDVPRSTAIKGCEWLSYSQMQMRRYGSARETLIKGLRMYGTPRMQFGAGISKHDKAGIRALLNLARCDDNLNGFDEARQACELVLKIEPSNAVARAELGLALAKLGNLSNGLAEIDAAMRLAPYGRLAEAFRNRAQIHVMQGHLDAAKLDLEQAIILRTSDVQYHLELGEVYAAMNEWDKARLSFTNAQKFGTDWPEPYYKLALLLKTQANKLAAENKVEDAGKLYNEAIEWLKKCHELDPEFSPAYSLHAEILKALGKPDDALKILDHGLRTAPGGTMNTSRDNLVPNQTPAAPEEAKQPEAHKNQPPAINVDTKEDSKVEAR